MKMHITSIITAVAVLFALSVVTRIDGSKELPSTQSQSEQSHLKLILNDAKETYKFGDDVRFKVTIENQSDQPANVAVIDTYYQNRPKLLRDGKVLDYRPKITQLVRARDTDTEIIRLAFVSIDPYSSGNLPSLNLGEWYGKLEPGSYRLTNKYRISFDGPWTKEAAEIQFRIVKEQ